jgi:hypothetical protein
VIEHGIILEMPNLPAETKQSAARRKIRALVAKGHPISEIVEKLAGGDEKKSLRLHFQIHQMLADDEAMMLALGMGAKGALAEDLYPAAKALGRRASKGNVPAIKLLMEATRFHSPRSEVEHSGEVQITIKNAPRPVRTEDEDIVDADVVE